MCVCVCVCVCVYIYIYIYIYTQIVSIKKLNSKSLLSLMKYTNKKTCLNTHTHTLYMSVC